ncbi:hypothetical protein [Clostridium celatum]|nr:hypothetical protein [Clostridium celatum]
MKNNVVFVESSFDVNKLKNSIRYIYFVIVLLGCGFFDTFFAS